MKTKIMSGTHVTVVAPYDVVTGQAVQVGAIFGISCNEAAKGAAVTLDMSRDVFSLPKPAKQAWGQGARIFWDAAARVCTTTSSRNTLIGAALGDEAGSERGLVLIGVIA